MSILTDTLPDAVEIEGREYAINTDFRDCLKVVMAFEDEELTGFEKQMILLQVMYPVRPDDTEKAMEMAIKFLDGGLDDKTEEEGLEQERLRQEGYRQEEQRLFSWVKDANFIFAAFKQTHGIDLDKEKDMHWWKFIALFMDLGSETFFCNLTALRKRIFSGKASEEDYRAARELGHIFELGPHDTRTPEQIEMDEIFDRALEGR